jgi:hypothetical protein
MESAAADIARRLGREAEAVCRHYLSNGRRQGRYWIVGDAANTPGRSLYVRLVGPSSGRGAAGKWTDAATGEHGDLLDLITLNLRLSSLGQALDEARRFLSLPQPEPPPRKAIALAGSPEAARRLFATARPIAGTLAETYLRRRGIVGVSDVAALRFHPHCYYWRGDQADDAEPEAWPALLAKVTDPDGAITGVHRTWIDPTSARKAPVEQPRKAMGNLLGNGVRIGRATDLLAAGEGLETMLSLRVALPDLPMVAALSAAHLTALIVPAKLHRLYIAVDSDRAGEMASGRLADRAEADGVEAIRLQPRYGDFNEDLRALGVDELRAYLRPQLSPADVDQLPSSSGG